MMFGFGGCCKGTTPYDNKETCRVLSPDNTNNTHTIITAIVNTFDIVEPRKTP